MENDQNIQPTNSFNTVTPFSKYAAMSLFIILPFAGFWLGMQYTEAPMAPSVGAVPSENLAEQEASSAQVHEVSSSTDWRVYKNEQYGFELRHPSDTTILEQVFPTYTNVKFSDENGLLLTFFVGEKGTDGPGAGWDSATSTPIQIAGTQTEMTIFAMDPSYTGEGKDDLLLSIRTQHGYDTFYAIFKKTEADTLIPKIESIVTTLKYTN